MLRIQQIWFNCVHDGGFSIDRKSGYDCFLMLFVRTKAVFTCDGKEIQTEPNTFIIYNINSPHKFSSHGTETYIDDFIQFESDNRLFSQLDIIFDKPIHIGNKINIPNYFSLISDCFYKGENSQSAEHLIKAMLAEIFSPYFKKEFFNSSHYEELLSLRKSIYQNPEYNWSISKMAEHLHVSEPHLQELYKNHFGVTCMSDVINGRIKLAKGYLLDTSLSVEEISYKCGYNSAVHFSRQFKQLTGLSPYNWKKDKI